MQRLSKRKFSAFLFICVLGFGGVSYWTWSYQVEPMDMSLSRTTTTQEPTHIPGGKPWKYLKDVFENSNNSQKKMNFIFLMIKKILENKITSGLFY